MNIVDFALGFDPTGSSNVTGAQLGQLVTSATPSSDHGMTLVSTDSGGVPDVPDASNGSGNEKWQRYLWIRIQPDSLSFSIYAWNPNQLGEPGLLYWNNISSGTIAAGSILGYMIANGTITKDKIANIDLSQINGYTALMTTSTAFPSGGDVTGDATSGLFIGNNKVTSSKLASDAAVDANRAVTTNSIKNNAVTLAKFDNTGATTQLLGNSGAGTPAWLTKSDIALDTNVVLSAGALKVPRINAGATAFEMVAPQGNSAFGRILQRVQITDTAAYNGATLAVGIINQNSGTEATGLKVASFTPMSATSTIVVRVFGYFNKITNDGYAMLAGCKGAAGFSLGATPVDVATGLWLVAGATNIRSVELNWKFTSGATTAIDIRFIIVQSTAGVAQLNPSTGYTPANYSYVEVTEYL